MNESLYILMRKIKAWLNSMCFYICRVFPIRQTRISVCTFEGKGGFGCNPKYLVRELHRRNPHYEFVWFVNDMDKEFPAYIKKIPNTLWSRAYWLSTSKIWIDNYRKPYGTCKRKGQYYLNVNHYTIAIKCTGLWRGEGFSPMAYLVSKNDSDMIDGLVIDSKWCEIVSPKGLLYENNYLKTGAPRCDILYGDRSEAKRKIREKYNLSLDAKIVMYAPTFRERAINGKRSVFSEVWSLDFQRLLGALTKRLDGKWYICIRVHPQLAPMFKTYKNEEIQQRILDESQNDDMYEVLAGMDAYITDYSSAVFEAAFANIPSFIYADDIEQYTRDRGCLMWELNSSPHSHVANNKDITPQFNTELPFPVTTNNDELETAIVFFDSEQYAARVDCFSTEIDLIFDGKASERLADIVENV